MPLATRAGTPNEARVRRSTSLRAAAPSIPVRPDPTPSAGVTQRESGHLVCRLNATGTHGPRVNRLSNGPQSRREDRACWFSLWLCVSVALYNLSSVRKFRTVGGRVVRHRTVASSAPTHLPEVQNVTCH